MPGIASVVFHRSHLLLRFGIQDGDNDWRGLNDMQFYVETNEIVSSAAKLNDFYLQKENDDQKLYTVRLGNSSLSKLVCSLVTNQHPNFFFLYCKGMP